MSADQQSRNSPEPENQTDSQIGAMTEYGKVEESSKMNEGKQAQTSGLSSNPTHILEQNAKDCYLKPIQRQRRDGFSWFRGPPGFWAGSAMKLSSSA